MKNRLPKYEINNISLDIRYDDENKTIWLTQTEIAFAFKISIEDVKEVIKKVFKSTNIGLNGEKLSPLEVQFDDFKTDGTTYKNKIYNLDMIEAISLHYKSTAIIDFIKWAKDYIEKVSNISSADMPYYGPTFYDVKTFIDGDFKIDITVFPLDGTVWLTKNDIAKLFETSTSNINTHIEDLFDKKAYEKDKVTSEILLLGIDGKNRYVLHYNLDMVFAIGCRINVNRALSFRDWSNNLLDFYNHNNEEIEKRLDDLEEKYQEELKVHNKIINRQEKLNKELANISKRLDELKKELNIYK